MNVSSCTYYDMNISHTDTGYLPKVLKSSVVLAMPKMLAALVDWKEYAITVARDSLENIMVRWMGVIV